MKLTVYLGLKKPDGNDTVNIEDLNYNADKIDTEIKKILDKVGDLTQLNTAQKSNLVLSINEVLEEFSSIKLEADKVTIRDLENLFTADKVEGALNEVMKKANEAKSQAEQNKSSILSLEKNKSNTNHTHTMNNIEGLNGLKTKVDNGQNFKLTGDDGNAINIDKADLNEIKKTGLYMGAGLTNAPNNSDWFFVEVKSHNPLFVVQIATLFTSPVPPKYSRSCTNGTWQPWKRIDDGQNFKLTDDDGRYIRKTGINIDTLTSGWFDITNATGTLPTNLNSTDNNVLIEVKKRDDRWCKQYMYDVRSDKSWARRRHDGIWQPWRSL